MKQTVLFFSALSALIIAISPNVAKADQVPNGGEVVESANFVGENDHVVSGEVQIISKGDIQYLVLQEDFQFDGAPDPRLGFSSNDEYDESSTFSGLNLDSGKQIYRLPATLDISQFDEATIWCEKFSVPLAEAKF